MMQNRQQRRTAEREARRNGERQPDMSPDQALLLADQAKGPYRSCVSDLQIIEWDDPEPRETTARWTISAFTAINLSDTNAPFTDALTLIVLATSEREALIKAHDLAPRNWYRVSGVTEVGADSDHTH